MGRGTSFFLLPPPAQFSRLTSFLSVRGRKGQQQHDLLQDRLFSISMLSFLPQLSFMKHKRRTHHKRTRVLCRLKIRKHRQLYLRPIACESRRLFQPKKVSVLAGKGGQSSSNKRRRKMIKETKETTRVFLQEKSKKHTNDVKDKDLF